MYEREIHEALKLIVEWRKRRPADSAAPDLDVLFAALAACPPDAYELEGQIWEDWTAHADPSAAERMNGAIAAIASRQYELAKSELDKLVQSQPAWAEAWNKRATLLFLLERDRECLLDIQKTLELEPRHFGAMAGFVQVCLRNGDHHSACIAMQEALSINPAMQDLKILLDELGEDQYPRAH